MRYPLTLCLLLATTCALGDTYRWTDSSGHTIVSDTPPPGSAKNVIKNGAKAEASDGLPFATKKAMESFPVTLYTAADCVAECKNARDLLTGRGVPFSEKMLQKTEEFEELKQLVGDSFVPSLKVGKQSFRGFEAGAYNNLLDLAGYPKTAPNAGKTTDGQGK